MARPKKPAEFKRVPISISAMPKIIDWLNERREYRTLSEEIHRILADAYNVEHPDDMIKYWTPDEKKEGKNETQTRSKKV